MRTYLLASALVATLGLQAQENVQRTYAADGSLATEEYMVGERLRHVAYHANGEVRETGWYTESGPEGTWKQYDVSGALLAKGHFSNGKRTGKWVLRDPVSGNLYKLTYRNETLKKGEELDGQGTLLAVRENH
jgi:antitoxin component YwqK of YwqJK toxin-antitoxin module